MPPDVYTYKDATAAISKAWSKLGKKKTTSDQATAAALAQEKEGKADRGDDERIEDITEFDEFDQDFIRGREGADEYGQEVMEHARGVAPPKRDSSIDSSERSEEPSTPEDSDFELGSLSLSDRKLHAETVQGETQAQALL